MPHWTSTRALAPLALLSSLAPGACFEPPEPENMTTFVGTGTTATMPDTTGSPEGSTTSEPSDTTSSTGEPPLDSSSGSTGPTIECGNGMVEMGEECDDGNTDDGDGCAAACTVDEGWDCDGADPTVCVTVCGDGAVGAPVEQCDDGNVIPDDDCTDTCQTPICGDGIVWMGNEICDDGGTDPGDGCDPMCQAEAGFICQGSPSVCAPAIYLADGTQGNAGNLWAMSLDGAVTIDMGPLGVGLTGMAFHPNGTLYGVTSGNGGPAGGVLGTIDIAMPPVFNPIGTLTTAGGATHLRVPDITFMGTQMLGWTESGDDLILIDAASAAVTVVTSPQGSAGTALAYDSAAGNILLAPFGPGSTLFIVSPMGTTTAGPMLGGMNSSVRGMAYFDGLLYAMDNSFSGGPAGNAVTFDPMTGAMVVLGVLPTSSIDALAVYDPNN